jgi:hypothetical protein
MFRLGFACEFFGLLQIFAAIPTRKPSLVTERMLVARSFSDVGRPGRDNGAKCKIYLNMADNAMRLEQLISSVLSSMDMDMSAEYRRPRGL